MKAVAIRLSALGDVTLTTGVLRWWHETRGLTFTVITRQALAPLFAGHPAVEAVVAVRTEDRTAAAWLRLAWRLARQHEGQPLVDLHGTARTRLLAGLWRGPVHRAPKLALTRRLFCATHHPWLGARLIRHTVPQRYALALEPQAPAAELLTPCLFPSAEERQRARELLARLGISRPLALHPYATHPAKTPNRAWWRQLLAHLEAAGVPALVIGHHPEPLLPGAPHDRTGQDALRQTIALLACCQGLVTGDSGPLHLACGVGTPVFALFGPTTPHWGFAPVGRQHHLLQAACPKAPCSLHGQAPCSGPTCLDRFDPQATAQAITTWLATLAAACPLCELPS